MDTAETIMIVGLGALAVGVAIGWHMRLQARKTRAAGASPTTPAPKLEAAPANRFSRPVASSASSAGCGCS
jgi:hypothetical protein